jgi:hypothetical protein
MKFGFIYCLGNQAMPGIFKIGMTERAPSQRVHELSSSTSAPMPFDLLCYGEVEDPLAVEREIHEMFELERINDGREFFRGSLETFISTISELCTSCVTTSDGSYYLAVDMDLAKIRSAESDAERVRLFAEMARFQCGIAMWREEEKVRFSCPISLVPQWIISAAAVSKSILLEHLPAECPIKPKRSLALIVERADA